MAGCTGVKDGCFLCCIWWGTSERFNDFVVYFINHCFLTRPFLSGLVWLSDLAPTHIVATGGLLLVAGGPAGARFAVVGCTYAVPMSPTVSIIIDDAWRARWFCWFLTHRLTDQREFCIHGFFQVLKFVVEHEHEFLHAYRVVVAVGCYCRNQFRRSPFWRRVSHIQFVCWFSAVGGTLFVLLT